MSHVSEIELEVRRLEYLKMAAERLGLIFAEEPTYRWWGISMGDYPLPKGISAEQLGQCNYTLSVPGKPEAYQVGVVAMGDGSYRLLWDFYNGGYGLQEKLGENGCKLICEYEQVAYEQTMIEQGYEISTVVHADGTREITATQA